MEFRWNAWNRDHVARHGVTPEEVELAAERPGRHYPRREGGGKYRVRGRTNAGPVAAGIYVFSPPGVVYVIHARPLTDAEKQQERKRR